MSVSPFQADPELAKKTSQQLFVGPSGIGRTTIIRTESGKEFLLIDDKIIGSRQTILPEQNAEILQSGQHKFITKEYRLPVEFLGNKQTPTIEFSLSDFNEIKTAVFLITLGASRQDIPLLGWKLDSITVNGKKFVSNHPTNAQITVHDVNRGIVTLDAKKPNTLIITHTPPLGAGILTPDIPIDVRLHVTGTASTLANKITGFPRDFTADIDNAIRNLTVLTKENTPVAIAIIALIAIIFIAIAWALSQPSTRAFAESGKTLSQSVNVS